MKGLYTAIAVGALCLGAAAIARTPVFIELDGVRGETTRNHAPQQPAAEPGNVRQAEATTQGGPRVAVGDVTGDGRPDLATSTQGPYQLRRDNAAPAEPAPRDIAAPRPAPQPLLLPAVQKGVGGTRVAPRPQNPPPPPPPPPN